MLSWLCFAVIIVIFIILENKKPDASKPKINACLYVCQDCLVHLGDLGKLE